MSRRGGSNAIVVLLVLLCGFTGWIAFSLWQERNNLKEELKAERAKPLVSAGSPATAVASPRSAGDLSAQLSPAEATKAESTARDQLRGLLLEDRSEARDLIAGKSAEESIRNGGMLSRTVKPGMTGLPANGVHAGATLALVERFWTLALADDTHGMKELKDAKLVVFTTGRIKVIQRVEQYYEVRFLDGPMKGEAMWVHHFSVRGISQP